MSEPLYQLEKGDRGELYICCGGERLVTVPASQAQGIADAIERIEGTRGQQLALRFFALGVSCADPANARSTRAGAWS